MEKVIFYAHNQLPITFPVADECRPPVFPFYDFEILFWNCSDSVVFLFFILSIICLNNFHIVVVDNIHGICTTER
jgi:hypothetical protein